jgi:hypothetical protein
MNSEVCDGGAEEEAEGDTEEENAVHSAMRLGQRA